MCKKIHQTCKYYNLWNSTFIAVLIDDLTLRSSTMTIIVSHKTSVKVPILAILLVKPKYQCGTVPILLVKPKYQCGIVPILLVKPKYQCGTVPILLV